MLKKVSGKKIKLTAKSRGVSATKRKSFGNRKREWSLAEEQAEYFTTPFAGKAFSTIDLFCGAGGLTEGFKRVGFRCDYANDINPWAIKTFQANHPGVRAEARPIEEVNVGALRHQPNLEVWDFDILAGVN